jgi:hypothetical protein
MFIAENFVPTRRRGVLRFDLMGGNEEAPDEEDDDDDVEEDPSESG